MKEPKTIATLGGAALWALNRARAAEAATPEHVEQVHGYLAESDRLQDEGNDVAALWAARCAWIHASWLATGATYRKPMMAGRKSVNGARVANDTKRGIASKQHNEWQQRADAIWKRHPNKSAADVAGLIAAKHGGNRDTIRRRIKKLA